MREATALLCEPFSCKTHNSATIIIAMRTIDQTIARIRAFAAANGWTKSRLAKEAGINDTTLRNFHEPDWNPTTDTIRELEAIIPQEFEVTPDAETLNQTVPLQPQTYSDASSASKRCCLKRNTVEKTPKTDPTKTVAA